MEVCHWCNTRELWTQVWQARPQWNCKKSPEQIKTDLKRRLVKGLLNGTVHVSSDLLNAETEKRNQEYLQLRKEDAHRTDNHCRRCYPDGAIEGSADGCWVFLCVIATVRLRPFYFSFSSLSPLHKNSSENQLCWASSADHSQHPSTPRPALLLQGDHQHCSRWPVQLLGFCIFIYNTRTNPLWTYYLTL